ncbi:MAG: CesT family type III secretion system chaperone [Parachlamydiaceae bacterium]|nr:CesT family type III secretion system chaperone [Parachlamydiaceae bacterium]
MVTDYFGTLLQELGKILEIPDLHSDRNNSCQITLKNGLVFQLEFDRSGAFIVLGADLGVVPPGKYRENLFREALKANDMPYPTHGILAYSKKSDRLVIFEKLRSHELTGEAIAAEIIPFSEKAIIWKEALERSDIPIINQALNFQRSSGMFGLRP